MISARFTRPARGDVAIGWALRLEFDIMMKYIRNNMWYVTVGLLLTLASYSHAAADGYEAPEVESAMPWAGVILALVALVGVCMAAFHNPKRSHLEED